MAKDLIKTIKDFNDAKLKEKGSVFIGQAYKINYKSDVDKILTEARKKFYDSTHVCFAYKLSDNSFHYSDDGEPSGTAGIRILNAIDHFSLVNTLVLVIRYFGGTKLGVGPLGKAYYEIAHHVLNTAKTENQKYYSKVKIIFDYNLTSQVHHIIKQYSAIRIVNRFENLPSIECNISSGRARKMFDELSQASAGKIQTKIIKEFELISVV